MLPIILGAALVGAVVGAFASGSNDVNKLLSEQKERNRKQDEHNRKQEEHNLKQKNMAFWAVSLSILSAPIEGIASAIGQRMGFEMWDAFGLSPFFQSMLSWLF